VVATRYDELVVDRLYDGKRQLDHCLQELLTNAAEILQLDDAKRKRTIVRIDAGGGDDADINWVLRQDYQLLVKVQNWRRAAKLAASVTAWYPDPKIVEREVGWVERPHAYVQPTRQLAVRTRKADGSWSTHVLVFTLTNAMVFELSGQPVPPLPQPHEVGLAALHAYDRRGGGVETQNKGDKQGLGLTRRNKRRVAAQEMLVLLAQLAHNFVIWTRNDLAGVDQRLHKYGIQRTVRDVLHIAGRVQLAPSGQVHQITLNAQHPLAHAVQAAFATVDDLSLILGQI
jgi:hypothetical protein